MESKKQSEICPERSSQKSNSIIIGKWRLKMDAKECDIHLRTEKGGGERELLNHLVLLLLPRSLTKKKKE